MRVVCFDGESHGLLAKSQHEGQLAACGMILETNGRMRETLCSMRQTTAARVGSPLARYSDA